MSYNLGPLPEETLTCELNDFDHVIFPNDVVDKEGADYCPLKVKVRLPRSQTDPKTDCEGI